MKKPKPKKRQNETQQHKEINVILRANVRRVTRHRDRDGDGDKDFNQKLSSQIKQGSGVGWRRTARQSLELSLGSRVNNVMGNLLRVDATKLGSLLPGVPPHRVVRMLNDSSCVLNESDEP